jgi:CrcB protein
MDAAQYFWVFVFGGLGSAARFGVASFAAARLAPGFPWGTLAVNLVGSALLAALLQLATASDAISPSARIALATGFLGGFTTYSAFSNETLALAQRGDTALALVYAGVTLVGCLAACVAGQAAARAVTG